VWLNSKKARSKPKKKGVGLMENKSWAIRNGFKGVYRDILGVRLPFEVKRDLEKKAKEKGLKVSDLVRLYIEKGLASEGKSEAIG
jgi:hypothetical protein